MIIEITSGIVFAVSVTGFLALVIRRMPAPGEIQVKALPAGQTAKQEIKNWMADKIKSLPVLRNFSWLDLAQKSLLKVRLVALKAENKINDYMVRLRQVADDRRKKDEAKLDNYWRELKTIVKNKNPLYRRNTKTSVVELADNSKEVILPIEKAAAAVAGKKTAEIKKVVAPATGGADAKSQRTKKRSGKKKRNKNPFEW